MEVQEALRRYIVQLAADGRSRHTIGQYRRHVEMLARWLKEEGKGDDVEEIGHEDLALFLSSAAATTSARGGPKKATSLNAMRTSLRTYFSYLHAAGYTATNVARLVRRARCGPSPPRGLSADDQQRLLAALAEGKGMEARRDEALFGLQLGAGVRIGAAVALDVGDVDLAAGTVLPRCQKNGTPAVSYLPGHVGDALAEYIGDRGTGPLFMSRQGRRITSRQAARRLAQWCERAKIRPISPHALRHSCAQRIYDRTRDLAMVKAVLHHRHLQSSLIYAQVNPRDVRAAVMA
ncbi:MAG: tyrosine-type recombinase/integrase [Candidatus Thermoplasmatota archaeon]